MSHGSGRGSSLYPPPHRCSGWRCIPRRSHSAFLFQHCSASRKKQAGEGPPAHPEHVDVTRLRIVHGRRQTCHQSRNTSASRVNAAVMREGRCGQPKRVKDNVRFCYQFWHQHNFPLALTAANRPQYQICQFVELDVRNLGVCYQAYDFHGDFPLILLRKALGSETLGVSDNADAPPPYSHASALGMDFQTHGLVRSFFDKVSEQHFWRVPPRSVN